MRKKLISTLAVCSIACCIGGMSFIRANADNYDEAFNSIVPLPGAAVRLDKDNLTPDDTDKHGIRFQAVIPVDTYKVLEGTETETRTVNYGMIIAPLDYETTYGEFTKENLFGENSKYYIDGVTEAKTGLTALTGKDRANLEDYAADPTKKIVSGALLNIPTTQLTREFVGIPYIRVMENGVNTEFYVAEYKDARSMVYVAQRAIQSGTLEDAEEKYLTENYVEYNDGTTNVASKEYTYTVEHIAVDKNGKELEILESYTAEKETIGTEISVNPNEYVDYTYDANMSNAEDIVYANNRTTLKLYYKLDIAVTPHLRQTGGKLFEGMSLEKETEGEFAGAYKYVNGQLGRANTVEDYKNYKYGHFGVYFDEVFNANLSYDEEKQKFFVSGYQYVVLDFYVTDTVYSIDFRHGDKVAEGWAQEKVAGAGLGSDAFTIYDKYGAKVNKWTAGEWYTLVIKPTPGKMLSIQTNAAKDSTVVPVMYIKNVTYKKGLFPTLSVNTAKGAAPLEKQTSGNFTGAYKYTNKNDTSVDQWGMAGVYFNEVYPATGGGYNSAFHDAGYKYIKLDFYATDSVDEILFSEDWTTQNSHNSTIAAGVTLGSAVDGIYEIYDENGNKVNKWTANTWCTLLIKPTVITDGSDHPLRIQPKTSNVGTAEEAPVMYIKNVSYESEHPFPMKPTLSVKSGLATLEQVTEGEFAGAYKYTNTLSGDQAGASGFYFNEINPAGQAHTTTFHDEGFNYVKLDFYATETVYSITFSENWLGGQELRNSRDVKPGDTLSSNVDGIFEIYDANGNKVNTWTVGQWYTLLIKPTVATAGTWDYPLRIQANAENTSADKPVMYIKDVTYLATNPFI